MIPGIDKYMKKELGSGYTEMTEVGDQISQIQSETVGYNGWFKAMTMPDFVGLDYSQINPIRESIRTYVKNIQKTLDKLNEKASLKNAIKGEAAKATKEYVKAVCDIARAYASTLLSYSDKMYEYGEEYKRNDTTLQETLSKGASQISSQAKDYTEKH